MRTPADLPRRLPRASRRTRIGVVVAIVVLILLIVSLRGLARFWTDYLWFQSVGFTSVFRGVLLTKVVLAVVFVAIFFLLMFGNLLVADRVSPEAVAPGEADEIAVRYREVVAPHARAVRIVTAVVFALLAGVGANREWNNWDLLRYHVSFGITDPEYHRDIGFYVFELPFIKFLLGWAFEALVVVLIVTAVAHYLNGGIHVQGTPRRVTAAVKTHLSVLLGALALVKAVGYYFQRLDLVLSRSHVVNGATATSVHANKPALTLLIAIAVIAAGLFLFNIRQKGWTLPAVAVALWVLVYLLVGVAYPALYQALRVNPSELTREAPYIQRNIDATSAAYGLDKVQVNTSYQYSQTVSASQIQGSGPQQEANKQTLANVRLLDPAVNLKNTFDKYQAIRQYYSFNDLDLDRYVMDDAGHQQLTATVASVRELYNGSNSIPSGFVNQHLEYTHGYGAVLAPIGQSGVNADGTPDFTLSDLPPAGRPALDPNGSEIYFGEGSATGGYVIAGSKTAELDYENKAGTQVTTHYTGSGGVAAGSLVRRAAFALRFGDANFLLSGQITPSSRVMFVRNVEQRVRKAAPFLKYDADPYAVILDGQVYWIIDAYTTTDNYPYSQEANLDRVPQNSGLDTNFNYVRNSVKVVVNAYDGSMHFFVMNTDDPIIKVYQRAFPDLFTPVSKADKIIPGIVAHFRYPEDLFRVQTNMYGRYHLTTPTAFYTQAQAWSVSPDPGSGQLSANTLLGQQVLGSNGQLLPPPVNRLQPQYVLAHLPGQTQQTFMLITPYVPVASTTSRQNLTAFMTASSGPTNYGQLTVYQTPAGETVDGPALIANAIHSNPSISTELTFLNQQGSNVELGEVTLVPIDQTLLYVEPVYVESSSNPIPVLKDVVVVYDGTAYQSGNASLDAALCQVVNYPSGDKPFSNYCNTPAAQRPSTISTPLSEITPGSGSSGSTTTTTTPATTVPPGASGTVPPPPAGATVQSLLQQAGSSFAAADAALKSGDLATYQSDVDQAEVAVKQASQLAAK
ncbi:MAG: UPF0182 family protein [Acidimicrobiales bacterium]